MKPDFMRRSMWHAVLVILGLCAAVASRADVVATVQVLRAGGCGGIVPAAPALRRDGSLDRAAASWAAGSALAVAMDQSGYAARSTGALHIAAVPAGLMQALRRSRCATIADASMQDIGAYQRGADTRGSSLRRAGPRRAAPRAVCSRVARCNSSTRPVRAVRNAAIVRSRRSRR